MAGSIFYWVLNMSILGSAAGLITMQISRIRALPRRAAILLWLLPFLRLICPVGIRSRYSLLSLLPIRAVEIFPDEAALSAANSIQAADSYAPLTFRSEFLRRLFETSGVVWVAVALAALPCVLVFCRAAAVSVKDAKIRSGNIYVSARVSGPVVCGIIRPRIVLPDRTEERDLVYILAHERAHIARGDNLWRIIALFTACLHWFNPFAWVFLRAFLSDIELACDEKALNELGAGARKEYAAALLRAGENAAFGASAFGGASTRIRIEHILSFRNLTAVSAVLSAVFLVVVSVAVLTNT